MIARRTVLKGCAAACGVAAIPASGVTTAVRPQKARFWHSEGDLARCELCPRVCTLDIGETAKCRTRLNRDGEMVTIGYANPCAVHVDPIEKKPFYHMLPGSRAFSIGVAGCCLRCLNCQNYTISQASPLETQNEYLPPDKVVEAAKREGCTSIAYTYSEATVWYEYMYDTAKAARAAGLRNIWVTSGYINEAPLRELATVMDGATIDVKSFDDATYNKLNAGTLAPVLATLTTAKSLGRWVEVSNLVVPQWTDNLDMIRRLCAWVNTTMGSDTPMHFLRFMPMHKLAALPPTPEATMQSAARIAREEKLRYVYVGNVAGVDQNTYCAKCGKPVVKRDGYVVRDVAVVKGKCRYCGSAIPGVWG